MKKESIDFMFLLQTVENFKEEIAEGETLGFKQILMLLLVLKYKNMTVTELAVKMNVKQPSISALSDKLIKKELIHRKYNALDRRSVSINLTEKGVEKATWLKKKTENIMKEIEEFITLEERILFNQILSKMNGF
ncbi:MarR family winged helix-turn-helix transcriptional regulator [Fictibacillus phosphorivorans]|uniref:MarR family winged helix-turn-helix transcriptional regulator n=1 Tax=Fictibacillus phosphorivorans TaxID=1221500 RepID=UPI003CF41AC5